MAATLAITSFNDGRYLADAVESALAQRLTQLEVLIADDGSTDPATLALLDRYESRGVRVLRRPHRGGVRQPQRGPRRGHG